MFHNITGGKLFFSHIVSSFLFRTLFIIKLPLSISHIFIDVDIMTCGASSPFGLLEASFRGAYSLLLFCSGYAVALHFYPSSPFGGYLLPVMVAYLVSYLLCFCSYYSVVISLLSSVIFS